MGDSNEIRKRSIFSMAEKPTRPGISNNFADYLSHFVGERD
jgi:hypothetical protein